MVNAETITNDDRGSFMELRGIVFRATLNKNADNEAGGM
jgi:hypothetical protein